MRAARSGPPRSRRHPPAGSFRAGPGGARRRPRRRPGAGALRRRRGPWSRTGAPGRRGDDDRLGEQGGALTKGKHEQHALELSPRPRDSRSAPRIASPSSATSSRTKRSCRWYGGSTGSRKQVTTRLAAAGRLERALVRPFPDAPRPPRAVARERADAVGATPIVQESPPSRCPAPGSTRARSGRDEAGAGRA